MDKGHQVTEQEIESSLSSVARLIDRYGDAYWPVFERLERELSLRKDRQRRVMAHLLHDRKTAKVSLAAKKDRNTH
ncbi:hypothetical protein BBF93_04590 [Hyphomonas sp. CACIAM 19H1]|uniref:hypothetical protein n=1 Tax=Hyphomonas sp. CACIAM 19H1 TaxID=1873716 RepID=UPI000DED533F|nr:hypothetical protein [Hyphomonas sp. CACIAM 19H1]AXE63576.1 hypothetical protein BBF93_04590 [Hyphomonas sp. CACIAM 19H1]